MTQTIHIDVRINYNNLVGAKDRILKEIDTRLDEVATYAVGDVQRNFSMVSPSPPGEPPGIVTGFLRASIYQYKPEEEQRAIVAAAEYAGDLEFGTRKMPARPFMRPAAARLAEEIPRFFRDLY